jgi:hypothetical protein
MTRKQAYQLWAHDVREALAIGYGIGHVNAATLRRLYTSRRGMAQSVRMIASELAR